jgi:hypothetical protein
MHAENKRILIIDEAGFSRVCSAILEIAGFGTEIISLVHSVDLPSKLNTDEFGLIVTSYPYGAFLFDEIKKRNIPTLILSDNIDGTLINELNGFHNSYCMIKPVNYDKFKVVVKQVISGELNTLGGYSLV